MQELGEGRLRVFAPPVHPPQCQCRTASCSNAFAERAALVSCGASPRSEALCRLRESANSVCVCVCVCVQMACEDCLECGVCMCACEGAHYRRIWLVGG